MPKCKACEHPQRKAIDKALLAGESVRNVATQFGLTSACVQRHSQNHMKPPLQVALERKEEKYIARTAEQFDQTLEQLLDTAIEIMSEAKAKKDGRLALQAINEARATIAVARKMLDGVTVNVQVNNVTLSDEEIVARAKSLVTGT